MTNEQKTNTNVVTVGSVNEVIDSARILLMMDLHTSAKDIPIAHTDTYLDRSITIGWDKKGERTIATNIGVCDVKDGFLAEGPSAAELKAAKQNMVGGFPLRLDSNRKILDNVAVIGFYGLPLDYLDRYAENVEKVTAADIRAAYARHVKLENLITVMVGGE